MLTSLYRRSLLYIEVPIRPVDRFAIPPLEGFVSNRTSEQGDSSVDPLEALLYSLFVANSERLTIAQLAGILNVDIGSLTTAMSVACRLGFATRASHEELRSVMAPLPPLPPPGSAPGTPHRGLRGSGGSLLVDQEEYEMDDLGDSGSVRATPGAISSSATITYAPQPLASRQPAGGLLDSGTSSGRLFPSSASTAGGGGSSSVAQSVAIVLDAEATSFLMMGALSPGLKRHSVTLFEGGRVAGEAVIKELIAELWVSYEAGQGFEGDMRALTDYAAAMATLLEMVRAASGQMEVELLRKESLEGLAPAAACKVLAHAYCAVVPITPLPHPPLPLAPASSSPLFLGASNEAAAPWLQLALYASARAGPVSLVLLCGQRLWRLPAQLERCTHALVWPWDVDQLGSGGNSGGGGGQDASQRVQLVESAFLLGALNDLLTRTAVMVQPLSVAGVPDAASIAEVLQVVDVPLPLPPPLPTAAAAAAAVGEEASRGSSGGSVELEGVEHPSLAPCAVTLPASTCQALRDLGLSRCLGFLRLYRIAGGGQQGTDVDGSAELPGFAATAADDGSGKEAAWQPLYVQLGVPLYCLPLCKAVCGAALRHDAGFLTTPGRASALAGLEQLHSHLDGLVAEYGLCARWLNDAGSGRQLGHVVEFPAHNLLFDGLSVHKVGLTDCLQGVGFTR